MKLNQISIYSIQNTVELNFTFYNLLKLNLNFPDAFNSISNTKIHFYSYCFNTLKCVTNIPVTLGLRGKGRELSQQYGVIRKAVTNMGLYQPINKLSLIGPIINRFLFKTIFKNLIFGC